MSIKTVRNSVFQVHTYENTLNLERIRRFEQNLLMNKDAVGDIHSIYFSTLNFRIMINGEDLKTFKNIEAYFLGKLNESEVDELWVEFLKDSEWFVFYEVELNLRLIKIKHK